MNGKKHSDIREDAYYDQLIKQRIGEALRNQSKEERLDMATLEAWVEADRQKRRARIKRGVSIACCLLILCFGTIGIKYALDYDGSVAVAGKNDDTVNESGNNVVIKPNEEDAEANTGVREIQCNSMKDVQTLKQKFPNLKTPHYTPDGYTFSSLTIKYSDLMEKYIYTYSNGKNELEIAQVSDVTAAVFSEYNRKIKCDFGEILIIEDKGLMAGCKIENGALFVVAKRCKDEELIEIMNHIN